MRLTHYFPHWGAFELLDKNRDGYVTKVNFKNFVKKQCKRSITDTEAKAIVRRMDKAGKGKINYEDWALDMVP